MKPGLWLYTYIIGTVVRLRLNQNKLIGDILNFKYSSVWEFMMPLCHFWGIFIKELENNFVQN